MSNIKELFFKTTTKLTNFLTQDEMIRKIKKDFIGSFNNLDAIKKESKIISNLHWFQKFMIEGKEFFVEKTKIPLKLKEKILKKEEDKLKDVSNYFCISLFCFFPIIFTFERLWDMIHNYRNKRDIELNKNVFFTHPTEYITFFCTILLFLNIPIIFSLIITKSLVIYALFVILNFICAFKTFEVPYTIIENFEIADFNFSEKNTDNLSLIEVSILNMGKTEIFYPNTKIEPFFLNEKDEQPQEKEIEKLNLKKYL